MRFYTGQHRYYCGIDLHARTMYLCILEHETGKVVLHRNLRCEPDLFLQAIAPYRDDLLVGVECIFCWYWLADLCTQEDIPFVLGHALYMKAIHGGKAKNDKIDAHKIAVLLRGGAFPTAYVYPRGMRATRDLLRRRLFFVRRRSELFTHIRMTFHQLNLPAPSGDFHHPRNRVGLADAISDPVVRASVEADLALATRLDEIIRSLELTIRRRVKIDDPETFERLQTIPGVGRILSLTLLYELHDIGRFPRVQDFLSYARLVKSQKASAGKITGTSGAKIGNAHLKWAYSEAAVLFLQKNPPGQKLINRLRSKHGRGKALSILAARLGRASYYMLRRSTAFDMDRFIN
ncbi:MAG: IS110 family transposase [Bacillota bacterium]|nr:IS110 family transposase [Bacillota bacterium]